LQLGERSIWHLALLGLGIARFRLRGRLGGFGLKRFLTIVGVQVPALVPKV
jgi:hypothetical protein